MNVTTTRWMECCQICIDVSGKISSQGTAKEKAGGGRVGKVPKALAPEIFFQHIQENM